jgi:hypothetical protein
MASPERLPVPDAELSRPALVLAQRFVRRWDLHARQIDDGSYVCVHEPLNVGHLFAHLRGEITLGAYLLDQESRARFVVLDADNTQAWERLGHLASALAGEDIPAYLERSRRGGHLWLFLAEAVAGREARAFGQGLLAAHQVEGVELYPKQDRLADGPEAAFEAYRSFVPAQPAAAVTEPPGELTGTLSERIKVSVTVLEFVSHYVDLRPTASGAVGLCPFHDDHHPSFGVNDEGNYWHCFAGCGGGSVIDFWIKWRGCDFTTAVRELAEMVL